MGDRGIVILQFPEQMHADIGIYTHWTGSSARDISEAIAATDNFRARLGDPTYAARIFIDQFTKDGRDMEIGYGVFPFLRGEDAMAWAADAEALVYVDLVTGEVTGR